MRLLHGVLSLDAGGLERVVVDLARAGRESGHEVAVACLDRPGTLAPQAEAAGVRIFSAGRSPGERLALLGRLGRIVRAFRPDVVHTHQIGALLYLGAVARRGGARSVIHTEHGKHYASRPRLRVTGRLAGCFAARFVCVSRDIAGEVLYCRIVPRRKIRVTPNGIDTSRFLPGQRNDKLLAGMGIPPGSPVVGTLGRLAEIKRQDDLLRAFAAVRKEIPDAHLLVVGDGPLRPYLGDLACTLGVADAVRFTGYREKPQEYLRAMDVFALTSRSEGMPLSVLESFASGVPVVASAVGGLPEMIDPGRTGLLFPPGNVTALAAALTGLLVDKAARERLAREARRVVVERHGLERMAADYGCHYRELLGRLGRRIRCAS